MTSEELAKKYVLKESEIKPILQMTFGSSLRIH